MSFRLVMAVLVGTGLFVAKLGLSGGATGPDVADSAAGAKAPGVVNLMDSGPRAQNGAKRITISPSGESPVEDLSLIERMGWDTPYIKAAFAKAGFNIGPDPRAGNDLDALRARQRNELGQLSMEEIGMEGFAAQIEQGMQAHGDVGQPQRFDAYDPQHNGLGGGGGMQVLDPGH